jgi:hypothetical protein
MPRRGPCWGKVNLYEFTLIFPLSLLLFNPSRAILGPFQGPGRSSGGSFAAVSSEKKGALSLGTDTAGSIAIRAAFPRCGWDDTRQWECIALRIDRSRVIITAPDRSLAM